MQREGSLDLEKLRLCLIFMRHAGVREISCPHLSARSSSKRDINGMASSSGLKRGRYSKYRSRIESPISLLERN